MSYLLATANNYLITAINLLDSALAGIILLENMSLKKRSRSLKKFIPLILYLLLTPWAGSAMYKTGMLQTLAGYAVSYYLTLFGCFTAIWAFLDRPFFTCWGTAVFSGLLSTLSTQISFAFATGTPYNLTVPREYWLYFFYNNILTPLIFILLLLIMHKTGLGKIFRQWIDHKGIWTAGIIFFSLLPIFMQAVTFASYESGYSLNTTRVMVSIFIVACVLIFNYISFGEVRKQKLEAQQMMMMQQNSYIAALEEMQTEMRRFRHDYKNMMSGMYVQAKEGNLNAIQNFIQEMTEDFDCQIGSQIRQLSQLQNVQMLEIKGLLLYKLDEMKKDRISCDLEVCYPFRKTAMKVLDLCRCLGILIDNAMDEVRGKKDSRIFIMISCQKDCTTFLVKNPLYTEMDFQQIWQNGYSTKGDGRGIGLASYKKIVESYHNVFSFASSENGYFVQELKVLESRV